MPIAPDTQIGPYKIVALIGSGGMGEVYRAHDTRLRRDVALKILPASFTNDPDRLRRFEQEARAVAALNHPNIVSRLRRRRIQRHATTSSPNFSKAILSASASPPRARARAQSHRASPSNSPTASPPRTIAASFTAT